MTIRKKPALEYHTIMCFNLGERDLVELRR